jgi:hypothetical protein
LTPSPSSQTVKILPGKPDTAASLPAASNRSSSYSKRNWRPGSDLRHLFPLSVFPQTALPLLRGPHQGHLPRYKGSGRRPAGYGLLVSWRASSVTGS